MSKKNLCGLAVVAIALVGSMAPAFAHDFAGTTRVTIKHAGGSFSGKVISNRGECTIGRHVILWKRYIGGLDQPIGRDTSDVVGRWVIPSDETDGQFYATADSRARNSYRHHHVCAFGRSRTLVLGSGVLGEFLGGDGGSNGSGDPSVQGEGLPFTGTNVAFFTFFAVLLVTTGGFLFRRAQRKNI